jgi:hypothetical protein
VAKSEHFKPTTKVVPVECPPVDQRPYIPAFNTPAKGVYHAACLHARVLGFYTHHIEGCTRPCLRSDTFCQGCRMFLSRRWEGYIGICLATNRSIWIAKITASAYRFSPTLMQLDGNLVGRRITFQRLLEKKNGPLKVVIGDQLDVAKLPRQFDLVGALSRRWSMDLDHLRTVLADDSEILPPDEPEGTQDAI